MFLNGCMWLPVLTRSLKMKGLVFWIRVVTSPWLLLRRRVN